MSLWQFNAATGGFLKANSQEDGGAITKDEAKALGDLLDKPPVWH